MSEDQIKQLFSDKEELVPVFPKRRIRLNRPEDVLRLLKRTVKQLVSGEISAEEGRATGSLCKQVLELMEISGVNPEGQRLSEEDQQVLAERVRHLAAPRESGLDDQLALAERLSKFDETFGTDHLKRVFTEDDNGEETDTAPAEAEPGDGEAN